MDMVEQIGQSDYHKLHNIEYDKTPITRLEFFDSYQIVKAVELPKVKMTLVLTDVDSLFIGYTINNQQLSFYRVRRINLWPE